MDNLYWLDQIQPADRPFVGNTAFTLSQLLQRSYPVVPGFVVPAIAFWEFIGLLGKSEPLLADLPQSSLHVDVDNPRQLQLVAQEIRQKIVEADLPLSWSSVFFKAVEAVPEAPAMLLQPSVSLLSTRHNRDQASYLLGHNRLPIGILESHVCPRQPEALAFSLKRVWAELFRARSLFYWRRANVELQQINLAVLVQPIWDAIASGAVQATQKECKIQATWGLGTAIAKGEVLPDTYQLDLSTDSLKTPTLGSKTLAYRLNPETEFYTSVASSLQPYLLSEEQQKQEVLDQHVLQQLIELCQLLSVEFTSTFCLEWVLHQIPGQAEPQLFLTHLAQDLNPAHSECTPSPPSQRSSSTSTLITKGLPAAVGEVTALAHIILDPLHTLDGIPPGRILISRTVSPDWLPGLKRAAGVVTEQGGMTSHAAILARELGIPAVVSATNVTQLIQTDEWVLVDGHQGEIHRVKMKDQEIEQDDKSGLSLEGNLDDKAQSEGTRGDVDALTPYQMPIATQLLVNLSQLDSLSKIANLPIDGIGLLRSELLLLNTLENLHPDEWGRQEQANELVECLARLLRQFAATLTPRSVFYRALDRRTYESQALADTTSPQQPDTHPVFGLHGTRRVLTDSTHFDLELTALKQVYVNGYTNVNLLLPFVRTVEEFAFCRRRVEHAGLFDNPHFQLWIMAEVPAVLFQLPDFVKAGVQGISIGTNDLTQLLLAVDREQGHWGDELNANHPAVRQAIGQLIQAAKTAGIPCSICGQAPAQYPELVDLLVRWGITSISVDVNDVEPTYRAIARAEHRLLLEAARRTLPIDK